YISGQQLSEDLSISRSAVWKQMNHLKKDGYGIEAVENKGYRIVQLPEKVVKIRLPGGWILLGSDIILYINKLLLLHNVSLTRLLWTIAHMELLLSQMSKQRRKGVSIGPGILIKGQACG